MMASFRATAILAFFVRRDGGFISHLFLPTAFEATRWSLPAKIAAFTSTTRPTCCRRPGRSGNQVRKFKRREGPLTNSKRGL
jgi:hypothetical protein